MKTTIDAIQAIEAEIKSLERVEFAVEHNSGTYSSAEGVRKVGCGSPEFCDYTIYETVAGQRRVVGCDPERAPGRARVFRDAINEARQLVARLRKQLREMR